MIKDFLNHTGITATSKDEDVDEALRSLFFADLERVGRAYEVREHTKVVNIKRLYQCGWRYISYLNLEC